MKITVVKKIGTEAHLLQAINYICKEKYSLFHSFKDHGNYN